MECRPCLDDFPVPSAGLAYNVPRPASSFSNTTRDPSGDQIPQTTRSSRGVSAVCVPRAMSYTQTRLPSSPGVAPLNIRIRCPSGDQRGLESR